MRDKIIENTKRILKEHLYKFENVQCFLFGSWARQEEKNSSDIDIAIDHDGNLPLGTISSLREAFQESTIPYRVEIVDLNVSRSGTV